MKNKESRNKEKELNHLFDENDSSHSYVKIVKKAKLISTLRTICITIIVVLILFVVLGFGWLSLMRWNQEKAMNDIELYNQITRPNVEELGPEFIGRDLFNGTLFYNRYKEIEGTPVNWSDQVFNYSVFGGVRSVEGDRQFHIADRKDRENRSYDEETKQRMMQFYHPSVNYDYIRNDLHNLKDYPNETLIEMGLSFDQSYTPNEVREFLPNNVTLKWYWADTYTDVERLKGEEETIENSDKTEVIPSLPEISTYIYGFDHIFTNEDESEKNEERFIEYVREGLTNEGGKYYGEYERIYRYLKGDHANISPQDIKVLGVVVTGSASELTELMNVKEIRAAELGVTIVPNK
ncbi:anti sigma factor C-terminal domain-containing protein [Metabacillus halosaccharovorans]|uniref:anti sigma factor C-terminal domain-containing protein n=1 Tax=Metabacillus halosaccharovorans TaxID=930124 RepID=UPI00203F0F7E|nr:anti sigma factor C-terminal domain-containing protein [Metabacillus halosaccharovorans]MCM3439594.1 anti-sigma factor [Metabacillus halosaccharovorans]